MVKPNAPACDRNKVPILQKLETAFSGIKTVLEIGSGTGQHAVFFAEHLPHIEWQTSDRQEHHAGIESWIKDSQWDLTEDEQNNLKVLSFALSLVPPLVTDFPSLIKFNAPNASAHFPPDATTNEIVWRKEKGGGGDC